MFFIKDTTSKGINTEAELELNSNGSSGTSLKYQNYRSLRILLSYFAVPGPVLVRLRVHLSYRWPRYKYGHLHSKWN